MNNIKFRAYIDERLRDVTSIHWFEGEIDMISTTRGSYEVEIFDDYKLMQYTGFKDSKGNDIYEGDIIQFLYKPLYPFAERFGALVTCKVSYDLGKFSLNKGCSNEFEEDIANAILYLGKLKVIGNIYENPELLEEVAKDVEFNDI